MTRILFPFLALLATPALAHDGLHFHPHGVQFGWLVVAALGGVGGLLISYFRGRK